MGYERVRGEIDLGERLDVFLDETIDEADISPKLWDGEGLFTSLVGQAFADGDDEASWPLPCSARELLEALDHEHPEFDVEMLSKGVRFSGSLDPELERGCRLAVGAIAGLVSQAAVLGGSGRVELLVGGEEDEPGIIMEIRDGAPRVTVIEDFDEAISMAHDNGR